MINTSSILQILVVTSLDWSALEGTLCCYERREKNSAWELVFVPIRVSLGKQGMAWGRGICDVSDERGLHKKEGDLRSPAGFFSLATAFGNQEHNSYAKNIPFLLVTDILECINDSSSIYYNQFIDRNTVHNPDWKSSEKMKEIGPLYGLGVVIEHNTNPIQPEKGSALFIHIWQSPGSGTAGCTAMDKSDLERVVSWLYTRASPHLVQLPLEEYKQKIAKWTLPETLVYQ